MKLRNAMLAATIMAAPVAAMAQSVPGGPVTGPYVSLGAGYNWLGGSGLNTSVPGVKGRPKLVDDGGPVAALAGGYGLGNGIRVELEGDYRYDHTHYQNFAGVHGGTNLQNYGFMGNVLYDFYWLNWPVTPYVGVGGGMQWTNLQSTSLFNPGTPGGRFGTKTFANPAVQGIIGVSYAIPQVPGLAVTGEYRLMSIFSAGNEVNGFAGQPRQFKLANQYDSAVMVGVRYNFGQVPPAPPPAPAPVAAPAPAPARTYLVFFDWDKADLTPRARQIIADAAQASSRVAVTKIEVSGYADRTGTARYNQALSMKRAQNVSAELVRLGVPQSSIAVFAYGDTRPLVPTAAGVREPQNRRVEIVLK
jgi:OOP family OmpA-OmpF porin